MRRSRSMNGSDDDSVSSGLSMYSSRSARSTRSARSGVMCASPSVDSSWKSSSSRSRTGAPNGRSFCYEKRLYLGSDFLRSNRDNSNSPFRIRYYKFTRRRIQILLAITIIFATLMHERTNNISYTRVVEEDSDSLLDDAVSNHNGSPFRPEQQDKASNKHPVQIYNSSPVISLSNGELFPLIGTSLGSIDPRTIPIIVSTQLNDVDLSSIQYQNQHKTPFNGAIALIAIESNSFNSNNGAVVARAIKFFKKKRNVQIQQQQQERSLVHRGLGLRGNSQPNGDVDKRDTTERVRDKNGFEIHIVTKVAHAQLGYGRTNLAIHECLKVLSTVLPQPNKLSDPSSSEHTTVKVHTVLHSPRCEAGATWNNCEEEEDKAVDMHIKKAGPSPNSNSWKDSWKALEEAYTIKNVKSIGVSNFNVQELRELFQFCEIKPHFYQGSIWNLLFDHELMSLLKEHEVLFHAFDVMHGIIDRREIAPIAYQYLTNLSIQLEQDRSDIDPEGDDSELEERLVKRLVLAWLVQRGIVVTPKVTSLDHVAEYSPSTIASFPSLSNVLDFEIEIATKALIVGEDVPANYFHHRGQNDNKRRGDENNQGNDNGMIYTFVNPFDEKVTLYRGYCTSGDCSSEVNLNYDVIKISRAIVPGEHFRFVVYPGDEFLVYNENGFELEKVTVDY